MDSGIGIPPAGGGKFRKFSGGAPRRECDDVNDPIDYKNLGLLLKYLTPQGKLQSRKRTKYCAQCQRQLAAAVKHARFLGLLPFVV
jgi:small subunit ribosomal protein S18